MSSPSCYQCVMCYEVPNNPHLCPRCSAVFCLEDIKMWFNAGHADCPQCRQEGLTADDLVKDRLGIEMVEEFEILFESKGDVEKELQSSKNVEMDLVRKLEKAAANKHILMKKLEEEAKAVQDLSVDLEKMKEENENLADSLLEQEKKKNELLSQREKKEKELQKALENARRRALKLQDEQNASVVYQLTKYLSDLSWDSYQYLASYFDAAGIENVAPVKFVVGEEKVCISPKDSSE